MKKVICQQKTDGTITVFLSLILLIILSLLFTIIEGARVSTARVYADRALTTAMDSVLAEYYGPLWDEYHILGYDMGEGTDARRSEQIAAKISDYMSYTLSPNEQMNRAFSENSLDLFDISDESIAVSNEAVLMDYDGVLMINEAVEYMKYCETGEGLEKLLGKMNVLKTPEKVSYLMEEKQKAEEQLIGIDDGILELMELLDGIATGKNGLKLTKNGSLKTTSFFIKQVCYEEVTQDNVGINQEDVFKAQKNQYVNPDNIFNHMEYIFDHMEETQQSIDMAELSIEQTRGQIAAIQASMASLSSGESSRDNKRQMRLLESRIQEVEVYIRSQQSFIERQKILLEEYIGNLRDEEGQISKLVAEIKPLISKAVNCIDEIIMKTDAAKPLLNRYEEILLQGKDMIGAEVYDGLNQNLIEIKKYIDTNNNNYDLEDMKVILQENLLIINRTEKVLQLAETEFSARLYPDSRRTFQNAQNILKGYRIKELTLDYSTIVLEKTNQDSPIDAAGKLLKNGITDLVIDHKDISVSEISTTEALPSDIAALSEDESDFLSGINSFFNHAVLGGENKGLGNIFGSFGDGTQITSLLGAGINKVAEIYLYQEYLNEHFVTYQAKEAVSKTQKPSVLTYEQEYLLAGKTSDQDNLASVITRVVFVRTIFDFVSIIGDKETREEAKLVAASLVGFTGLPILVSITQVMILLIWSFAEALLDTCGLLMGKEIPILKKTISMEFPELFLINREYLQQKAEKITNTKELSFSYQDYLKVFLLMESKRELAYRSMDLMQENIRLRYNEDDFQINNCLFGFNAEADFRIEDKFTAFSFVQRHLKGNPKGFRFYTKATYSY